MASRTRRKVAWLVTLCSATSLAVACGGDDDNDDTPAAGSGGSAGTAGSAGKGGSGGKGGTSGAAGENNSSAGAGQAGDGNGQAGDGNVGGAAGEAGSNGAAGAGAGAGNVPDADLSCLGATLGTEAVDPLSISGIVVAVGVGVVQDAAVAALNVSDDASLADTTSNAGGAYTLVIDSNTDPVDAYLSVTATGYLDSYVYPPVPFLASTATTSLVMVTSTQRSDGATAGGVTLEAGTGLVYVLVVDCNGDPIEGATISSSPGGDVVYVENDVPSAAATATDASGRAIIFNVGPGDVEVDAEIDGTSLREHTVNARADAFTFTAVIP